MGNHGTDPSTRFAWLAERVEAMTAIWTSDEASYHGRFVDFERIWSWPKPVQQPHPPIQVGGAGLGVLDRVLKWGDGWMRIAVRVTDLPGHIAELRRRAADAGRGHVPVTVFGAEPQPEAIDELAEAGADHALLWLRPAEPETVRAELEQYAQRLGVGAAAAG